MDKRTYYSYCLNKQKSRTNSRQLDLVRSTKFCGNRAHLDGAPVGVVSVGEELLEEVPVEAVDGVVEGEEDELGYVGGGVAAGDVQAAAVAVGEAAVGRVAVAGVGVVVVVGAAGGGRSHQGQQQGEAEGQHLEKENGTIEEIFMVKSEQVANRQ